MSMLTPPGMGGKYRITGNRYPHMRRPRNRRRIVLAVVATAAVLGLAGWGTLQLVDVFSGDRHKQTQAAAQQKKGAGDCKGGAGAHTTGRAAPRELPKPGDITVNVYNATPRGGLAKVTADELERRGFRIGKVGNAEAEYDKKVPGTALLVGPQASVEGALKVLATQVAGAEAKGDQREGQDVDLVLGDAYKELKPKEEADKALAGLAQQPKPQPSAAKC
ncbi:LytR C-terminal domain-containing protein [Streptomyces griseocarneus]|uniref:LytR C-terminal domain-containing protein n=1 Tax=Streptomyces griseocarneus TaxID=51201 RepID=UPI00167C5A4F|nr:LytR C-terminal domain-containing protein [Streptomyces griseocarneus]MBZ6473155.1 LytR C-terminal domain-containing protein [Streptomyces griseocarneus]GHG60142.1 membrane protein [Streptomyces griseocarneus]